MLNQVEYNNILERILKNGIRQFKSNTVVSMTKQVDKNGVIAGYDSKRNMSQQRGLLYRSMEQLYGDSEVLTHWTPNVFSWLGGGNERPIYGHTEENLIQINTFVADIDFPAHEEKPNIHTIVLYLLEEGLLPTLVLDTPRGYHVYFLIQNLNEETGDYNKASYISKANTYKSLRVAKRISENIRTAIKNRLPQVDMGCNHFGIFRFPTPKNIVHYEPNFVDTFEGYLNWSKAFEDKEKAKKKSKLTVIGNKKARRTKGFRQTETKWFDFLLHADIAEGDRNRTIFTLALACKQSGLAVEDCIDLLDQVQFNKDLSDREVKRCVNSAYNGRYNGAKGTHINELIESYATPSQFQKYAVQNRKRVSTRKGNRVDPMYWVKFKKAREDRKYSHFSESQADLLVYLESKEKEMSLNELYLTVSMKDIAEATKIPLSSLKVILKELKDKKLIIVQTKRGRNGNTRIATRKAVETKVLMAVIFKRKNSSSFVIELMKQEDKQFLESIVSRYEDKQTPFKVNTQETIRRSRSVLIRAVNTG